MRIAWNVLFKCFINCYLPENNFQLSGGIHCSKALDYCYSKVQSIFNGYLRKLKNWREVSQGGCWEIGTLSKMKCPSWTSLCMPAKCASYSLCSTIFTSGCFVAFEGRLLSNSSITEVSEVNKKLVTTWLKKRKKWRKHVASFTHYFIPCLKDHKKKDQS